MTIRQVWIVDDDAEATFATEAEAKLYELEAEFRKKIFDATGGYFNAATVIAHPDAVRDLLDAYLIKRAELQK